MSFRCIRINVDGTATALPDVGQANGLTAHQHAHELFGGDVEVVSLKSKGLEGTGWALHGPDVGFVHGTGMFLAETDPLYRINPKGWGLYGLSPIFGPIIVADDRQRELDPVVLEWVQKPTWLEMMVAGGVDPGVVASAQQMMVRIAHREFGYVMVPGL